MCTTSFAMAAPSFYEKLTPEQVMQIKNRNNEDEDRFAANIRSLENWIDKHPFIPKNYESAILEIFLRGCKYDMEATKQKLEMYFVQKIKCPRSFKVYSLDQSEQNTLNNFYFMPSSKLTPEGYKVAFIGLKHANLTSSDVEAICKIIWISAIHKANQCTTLDAGNIMVLNMEIFSPALVVQLLTPLSICTLKLVQASFPFRVKQIFIINAPGYAENAINIFKRFLYEKIRNRVIIETSDVKMKTVVPDYCIPSDFGGTADSIADRRKHWFAIMKYYEPWFNKHEKVLPTVDKIPKERFASAIIDDELGTQGSFRQLSID